jgi:hypothetical protein
MSDQVVKVVELFSESDKPGGRHAAGLYQAGKTPHGIKSIQIRNSEAMVETNKIVKYRINARLSSALDLPRHSRLLGPRTPRRYRLLPNGVKGEDATASDRAEADRTVSTLVLGGVERLVGATQ